MTTVEFFNRLYKIAYSYDWNVDNRKIEATIHSGPNKGFTLNPVTALAHKAGLGLYDNTRDGTEFAGSLLGLTRKTTRSLYTATLGSNNHGNAQVVRGRIRSALEV